MNINGAISSLAVFSCMVFARTALAQQNIDNNPPFTLELTANLEEGHSLQWDFANTAERVVRAGSMIVVAVRKVNRSDHDIAKIYWDGTWSGYRYEVRDSSGALLKHRTQNGPIVVGGLGQFGSAMERTLQPGKDYVRADPISDWFDMSRPGKYTIQVLDHASNNPASDVIKSNSLVITVLVAENSSSTQ